jgi:Fe-Mn family superoxide dismutase
VTDADASSAFTAAQRAAGVIAAKHRSDLAGAHALLAAFPDETTRTRGFQLLAELALTLTSPSPSSTSSESRHSGCPRGPCYRSDRQRLPTPNCPRRYEQPG